MGDRQNNQFHSLDEFLRKEGYLVEKDKAPMQDTLYLFRKQKRRKWIFLSKEETVPVGEIHFHKDINNGKYEKCVLELHEQDIEKVGTIIRKNYPNGFGLEIKIRNGA